MNIETKLALVESSQRIVGIKEVLYGGLPIEALKQAGIDIGTEAVN